MRRPAAGESSQCDALLKKGGGRTGHVSVSECDQEVWRTRRTGSDVPRGGGDPQGSECRQVGGRREGPGHL